MYVSCHARVSSNLAHAFYVQQRVDCEDCHSTGSLRVNGNGVEGFLLSPVGSQRGSLSGIAFEDGESAVAPVSPPAFFGAEDSAATKKWFHCNLESSVRQIAK